MSTLINDGGRSLWPIFQRGACVLAVMALTACASRMDNAPVVDRTGGTAPGLATTPGGPLNNPGVPLADQPVPPGYYRVKPGDTLYRVALENGQNYRNISLWNNLTNPNQIEVGQLLRVAPPGSTPSDASSGVSTMPLGGGAVQSAPLGATPPASGSPSGFPSPYANGGTPPGGMPSPYASQNNAPAPSTSMPSYTPPLGASAAPLGASAATAPPSVPAGTPPAASGPISFIWPVQGQIVNQYNGTTSKGIDIAGSAGTPIVAAAAGRVLYAGNSLRGYGNLIIIKHDNTFLTAYGHNRTLLVKENDVVTKGQTIAEMGDTQADRVMLHFEVRKDTKPVDPLKYLPPR